MAMPLHEPAEELSAQAREMHRAINSLIEELEAINWYHQRADVTAEPELREILLHNRDEEVEHACMALEWIRRKYPIFDENLRTYLFASGNILAAEEAAEEGGGNGEGEGGGGAADGSLGLGSLRD